jgi:hypothetical protein
MKENKNIDRLFQEKLKDFEAIPDAQTGNKITSQELHSKKEESFYYSNMVSLCGIVPCLFWVFYYLKIKKV